MSIRPNPSWPLLDTAGAVIDAVGGPAAAGKLTDNKLPAVSNWRARNRLPPDTYLLFSAELERLELRAPSTLWSIKPVPSEAFVQSDH